MSEPCRECAAAYSQSQTLDLTWRCVDHGVVRAAVYAGARERELEEALEALIEDAEDMRAYVPEIFQEKWGHKEAIDKARAALHPKETP